MDRARRIITIEDGKVAKDEGDKLKIKNQALSIKH
jgi:hypothetical protein